MYDANHNPVRVIEVKRVQKKRAKPLHDRLWVESLSAQLQLHLLAGVPVSLVSSMAEAALFMEHVSTSGELPPTAFAVCDAIDNSPRGRASVVQVKMCEQLSASLGEVFHPPANFTPKQAVNLFLSLQQRLAKSC